MRTVIIIAGGFFLLTASLVVLRLMRKSSTVAARRTIRAFIAVWFVVAVVNMWIGVTQAGYTFTEELPIFLVIFLLPVGAAFVIQRKFQKQE